ncbi:hypothetical protein PR048_000751 [Dryococelus australis]|uniref:Carboxylesterase type B domain-containing protein n=1 Tax=Dryococelus australis TaxID=614101 RepID=A0ABQ9IGR1_9NEOP|nr:hypothetical protein PR048_000751 [Dryococelus australis]
MLHFLEKMWVALVFLAVTSAISSLPLQQVRSCLALLAPDLRIHAIGPADFAPRLRFCTWFLYHCVEEPHTPWHIFFMDEPKFNRKDVFSSRNSHVWTEENPHTTHTRGFQERYAISVWAGYLDGRDSLPLYYFLWGHLKSLVYETSVDFQEDLVDWVMAATDVRLPDVCEQVYRCMAGDGTVTVQTEDGFVRGNVATSIWNRTYHSFQAIPYAQPPIGDLRFKNRTTNSSYDVHGSGFTSGYNRISWHPLSVALGRTQLPSEFPVDKNLIALYLEMLMDTQHFLVCMSTSQQIFQPGAAISFDGTLAMPPSCWKKKWPSG